MNLLSSDDMTNMQREISRGLASGRSKVHKNDLSWDNSREYGFKSDGQINKSSKNFSLQNHSDNL